MRVRQSVHARISKVAERIGCSQDDALELMSSAFIDRSNAAYQIETAHLLREIIAFEMRLEQLVLSNLSLAECVYGLEGAGLKSLIQLNQLARAELQRRGGVGK